MYKIASKKELASNVKLLKVYAPQIARKTQPGNFVIVKLDEKGERIPITLAGCDMSKGTISIAIHEVGKAVKSGHVVAPKRET